MKQWVIKKYNGKQGMKTMKGPILVVLAAGIGSRYGGVKQMEKFGKNGEVLLDYSVYDALRGGFDRVVFIIRKDLEKDFRETVLTRMEGKVKYELAWQELDSLIPHEVFENAKKIGRSKPWGTAHALLCAADKIDSPFAVINADDFYGREAFAAMGKFLAESGSEEGAIVPYLLEPTLSKTGTVARGVCKISDGYIVSIDELVSIEKKDGVIFNTGPDGTRQELARDTPVSMNFLAYPDSILPRFKQFFDEFIAASGGELKSECYLPKASDWFIKNSYLKMRVLKADSEWFGVTYKEDKETAIKRLSELTSQGVYPASLWS
jgi:NDP-sugar pyrophosphorylase family protein